MKCDFERLCLYLNDKLDEKQKRETTAHLQKCDICLEAVLAMLQDCGEISKGCTPDAVNDEAGGDGGTSEPWARGGARDWIVFAGATGRALTIINEFRQTRLVSSRIEHRCTAHYLRPFAEIGPDLKGTAESAAFSPAY